MFEGVEFLGIDWLVGSDDVGAQVGDFVDVFETDDGELFGGKAVFAGVAGGAGAPVGLFGPVDLAALARLAASCFSEMGFLPGL